RYVHGLVRWRWPVLGLLAVATLVVAAGMSRLRTEFSVESSLPADHPFVQIDKEIRTQFGGRRTLLVAIVPREGDVWRPEVLKVVREFTLAALRLPDVMAQNVVSLAAPSVRTVEESGGAIKVDYLMRDVPETPEAIAALRAKVEADPQLKGMLVTDDQRAAMVVLDFYEGKQQAWEIGQGVLTLTESYRDRGVD